MNRHTEMLAQLRDCPEFSPQIREAAQWALDRLAEPPAVTVKPLVWVDRIGKCVCESTTIIGPYEIYQDGAWIALWFAGYRISGAFSTLEAAKAAAQADYAARIRSALKGDAK